MEKKINTFPDSSEWIEEICCMLEEKKACGIKMLCVKDTFPLADYFIIAGGSSSRHLKTLCEAIEALCKKKYDFFPVMQGHKEEESHWIVMDLKNVFLHLFLPDFREYYKLEEFWSKNTSDDNKKIPNDVF